MARYQSAISVISEEAMSTIRLAIVIPTLLYVIWSLANAFSHVPGGAQSAAMLNSFADLLIAAVAILGAIGTALFFKKLATALSIHGGDGGFLGDI